MLIVGLGNPTSRYEGTRHNIGFAVVDELLRRSGGSGWRPQFKGELAACELGGERVQLLKPQTFMNLSGESVQPALAYFKTPIEALVVVHDELDLPFGAVRLKKGGGEAGHNGLRSISQLLGTKDYIRMRVGIGRPPRGFRGSVADYVLQNFDLPEAALLPQVLDQAREAMTLLVKRGLSFAMNRVNQAPHPSLPPHTEGADVREESK